MPRIGVPRSSRIAGVSTSLCTAKKSHNESNLKQYISFAIKSTLRVNRNVISVSSPLRRQRAMIMLRVMHTHYSRRTQKTIIPNEHQRRVSGGNSYDEFLMKTGGYPLWRFRLAITELRIPPDYAIQS